MTLKNAGKGRNALFFLAFALHPSFRETAVAIVAESQQKHGNWESKRNPLSVARLTHSALFDYDMKELHPPEATEEEREEGRDNLKIHIHKWLTVTSNIGVPRYQGEKK